MFKRCGFLVLTLLLTTGCAIDYISPKDPEIFIPDRSAEVVVGLTERAAVRGVLGAPQLSSAYWGFDLFRINTEQTNVLVALTPWPIPFAREKDQLHRYTLVTYDAKGLTSAIATGIFRRPTRWRNVSPIRSDYPSLHLRTGELMFFLDPEGARDVNILAAPNSRDMYLQHAKDSPDCVAVLGCGDRGCGDQLSVDAGPIRRLPMRIAHAYWFKEGERDSWLKGMESSISDASTPWFEALVALKLTAGKHLIEISAKHLGGAHSFSFTCCSGKVIYMIVSASDNESFLNRVLANWQIEQTDNMPESFARRPLVLLDDGKWYVDAEPLE